MLQGHRSGSGRYAMGWYRNVFLSAWWDAATYSELVVLREAHREFIDATQGPLAALSILHHPKPKSATREERQVLGEIFAYHKERFAGLVFYVKAGGLMTASLQLFLSALKLISKSSTNIKIYNSLPESLESALSFAEADIEGLSAAVQLLNAK